MSVGASRNALVLFRFDLVVFVAIFLSYHFFNIYIYRYVCLLMAAIETTIGGQLVCELRTLSLSVRRGFPELVLSPPPPPPVSSLPRGTPHTPTTTNTHGASLSSRVISHIFTIYL